MWKNQYPTKTCSFIYPHPHLNPEYTHYHRSRSNNQLMPAGYQSIEVSRPKDGRVVKDNRDWGSCSLLCALFSNAGLIHEVTLLLMSDMKGRRICPSCMHGNLLLSYVFAKIGLTLLYVTVAIMTLSSEIEQHSTNSILDGQLEILITQLVPINF